MSALGDFTMTSLYTTHSVFYFGQFYQNVGQWNSQDDRITKMEKEYENL